MEKRYVSALLSGLVFPGAGQLYNKEPVKGFIYILLTVCCLIALVCVVVRGIWRALEFTASTGGTLWDGIAQGFGGSRAAIVALLLILGMAWAVGIADAYLTARRGEPRQLTRFIARKR